MASFLRTAWQNKTVLGGSIMLYRAAELIVFSRRWQRHNHLEMRRVAATLSLPTPPPELPTHPPASSDKTRALRDHTNSLHSRRGHLCGVGRREPPYPPKSPAHPPARVLASNPLSRPTTAPPKEPAAPPAALRFSKMCETHQPSFHRSTNLSSLTQSAESRNKSDPSHIQRP